MLTAEPRKGSEIVVSEGGVNTTGLTGKRKLTIRLIDTATLIPRGARLTLTLASSSVAQNPGNLLYLNLPMPRPRGSRSARPADPADPAHAGLAVRGRALALARARPRGRAAGAAVQPTPGVTPTTILIGGTVPLERPGVGVRHRRPRARRPTSTTSTRTAASTAARSTTATSTTATTRRRPSQLTRQLVQQDNVFAIFNIDRHRAQPRHPRLPERAEGAAALRRQRARRDRPQPQAVPVDDGLPAELSTARARSTARYVVKHRPKAKIAVLYENTRLRQGPAARPHAARARQKGLADRRQAELRADRHRRLTRRSRSCKALAAPTRSMLFATAEVQRSRRLAWPGTEKPGSRC